MAAVSQLIGRGIGFNPGSVKYVIGLGLAASGALVPTKAADEWPCPRREIEFPCAAREVEWACPARGVEWEPFR